MENNAACVGETVATNTLLSSALLAMMIIWLVSTNTFCVRPEAVLSLKGMANTLLSSALHVMMIMWLVSMNTFCVRAETVISLQGMTNT